MGSPAPSRVQDCRASCLRAVVFSDGGDGVRKPRLFPTTDPVPVDPISRFSRELVEAPHGTPSVSLDLFDRDKRPIEPHVAGRRLWRFPQQLSSTKVFHRLYPLLQSVKVSGPLRRRYFLSFFDLTEASGKRQTKCQVDGLLTVPDGSKTCDLSFAHVPSDALTGGRPPHARYLFQASSNCDRM